MVEAGDHVTLMDFGVARLKDSPGLTLPGIRIGTPYYMAPEQIAGKPSDHRADLYSLGVVLYQMLAARLPFPGPTTEEVYAGHVQEPPPPLGEEQPAWIRAIVARALEKDPGARYQSADAFIRALDERRDTAIVHDRLHLHVTSGHAQREFALGREVVIGRADPASRTAPDVELRFDDAVSRRHARIFPREGAFFLEDLGSANGTSLNGRWLRPRDPVALSAGDLIAVGEKTLIRVRTASLAH
jgi:serine/threonine protein kinase